MMSKRKEKLGQAQEKIIKNVIDYVKEKKEEINSHYLTVKLEDGKDKNNDIYEMIDTETYNYELLKVSIVILTANYFECEILNYNVFKDSGKKIKRLRDGLQPLHDRHIVKAYIMEINGYSILHLHAPETGSNTPCGSSDLVRYVEACEFIDPSCIISFGICYGTNYEDFSLGDTIIAEKIYPWSIGIKINDDGWKIKCDDYVIDLREQDATLYDKIQEVISSTQKLCANQKAEMGNMLTAEAVVSNERVKIQAIQNSYTCNIVGGEMEGYGLAKECIYYNKTPCVILKAICDWGAVKNIDEYVRKKIPEVKGFYKDKIQAYTTFCAYKVLSVLFNNEDNVFKKSNVIVSIHDELLNKYYSDGSISRAEFNDFIEEYLKNNYRKYSNMSIERQESVKNTVINSIVNQYFRPHNDGYIFNEHLF